MARRIIAAAALLAIANALIFAGRAWIAIPAVIVSASMEPTLVEGQRVLVSRLTSINDLSRGDIVLIRVESATDDGTASFSGGASRSGDNAQSKLLVKRVIGLPGESIQGAEQTVAVDQTQKLNEPYARWNDDQSKFGPVELEEDEFWVMGDQRDQSVDSRDFGAVPEDALVGSLQVRFWPLNEIGKVE